MDLSIENHSMSYCSFGKQWHYQSSDQNVKN